MFGKRKRKRNLDNIGKNMYNFDFSLEKKIYKNLCCIKVKGLDRRLEFDSYNEWKQYIIDKYSDEEKYPIDKLEEFSRYLNQRLRLNKPNREYWSICITVIITWFFTKLLDSILETYRYDINFSFAVNFFTYAFLTIVLIALVLLFLWHMYNPILDSSIEEGFLSDYKEIIDEIIENQS